MSLSDGYSTTDNVMVRTSIEPGILRLLRWYAGIRLALLILVAMANRGAEPPQPPQFPTLGIVLFGALFILLIWRSGESRLGGLYLPLAILLATVAPIADSASNIGGRLASGMAPNETLGDYWIPFFLLFVPFVLTAWQYRYRWVLVFALGSTVLDFFALGVVFAQSVVNLEAIGALLLARGFLFAFLGFFISKLIARQRELRAGLQRHASTLEQLATGRERNRLARELHDTLAHSMTATAVQLEAAQALWEENPQRARGLVDEALVGTRTGLAEARRAIEDLRASPLEEHGLEGALEWLISESAARSGMNLELRLDTGTRSLSPALEQTIYRIVEESLANVIRHSSARSAAVALEIENTWATVSVIDDGVGFDTASSSTGSHGIRGMRERAALVGGELTIESKGGLGTTVVLSLPVDPGP